MRTPVWFAEEGGTLYVYSEAEAGKVKRIRNNPRVRVMPCGIGGAPKGTWVDAQAAVADTDLAEHRFSACPHFHALLLRHDIAPSIM